MNVQKQIFAMSPSIHNWVNPAAFFFLKLYELEEILGFLDS